MRKDLPLPPGCVAACRACHHRTWEAGASTAQKEAFLHTLLGRWQEQLQPLSLPEPHRRWHYRTRVKLAARWQEGRWECGMEPRDDFIPLPDCPVHASWVNAAFAAILTALPGPADLPLRYLVQSGGITTLIVKAAPAQVARLMPDLTARLQGLGLEHHIQALKVHAHPAAGRRLFAKNGWFTVFGPDWVQDDAGLWHGPTSFQQALPEMYRASVQAAEHWLQPGPEDAVVDLYCGIGATLQRWTAAGARTLGIEASVEAIAAARRNAPEATALVGYCASRLPQLRTFAAEAARRTLAYVNPPRTGLEPEISTWLGSELHPQRIAYLSCSPGTLRRDLLLLEAQGFRIARLQPYDFFPQTHHVEVLACLESTS